MRTRNAVPFQRGHAVNILSRGREARLDELESRLEEAIKVFEAAQAGQCEVAAVLDRIQGISAASWALLQDDLINSQEAN